MTEIVKEEISHIHILNGNTGEIVATLDNTTDHLFWEAEHEKELESGSNKFSFFTNPAQAATEHLTGNFRALIPDEDGSWAEFVALEVEQDEYSFYVVMVGSETLHDKEKIMEVETHLNKQPAEYALLTATDTWQPGQIDYAEAVDLDITQYIGAFTFNKMAAEALGLELVYRVETDGYEVTGRYYDMLERLGEDTDKIFEPEKDLISLKKNVNNENVVTALFVIGAEQEDGTRMTTTVTNYTALQNWGWQGQHLTEPYEAEGVTKDTPLEVLRRIGTDALNKRIASLFEYEVEAVSIEHLFPHEKAHLGDRVGIVNTLFNPPIYAEARVIGISRRIDDRSIKSLKIGEIKEKKKSEVTKTFLELQRKFGLRVLRQDTPPAGNENIIWVKTGGTVEVAHVWDGAIWRTQGPTTAAEIGAATPGQVDTAKTEAIDAAKVYTDNALDDFQLTIESTFKDGIIEESEAIAIEKYKNTLNAEKIDNDNRYTSLYGNADLIGAAKTGLATAKTDYNNAHAALISSVDLAIADNKTTPAEKTTVDNNFITYRTRLASLSTAFETANNAIAATKAQAAEDAAKEFTTTEIDSSVIAQNAYMQEYAQRRITEGPVEPENPEIDDLWIDTSSGVPVWKRWDGNSFVAASITSLQELNGVLAAAQIAVGGIAATHIAAGAITEVKISEGAITDAKLAELAVTAAKIANGAITGGKVADNAITNTKLAALAVDAAKLAAGAVTDVKIADAAVVTGKLADLAITAAKLGNSAVTDIKIATGAVTTAKILDDAINAAKIAAGAVTELKIGTGAITNTKLAALAVDAAKLADGAVLEVKIANSAITNAKLAALAVDAAKLAAGAVTEIKIADNAVTVNKIIDSAITNAKIAAGAVTELKLGNGAITNAKLAALAVDAAKLADSAVTSTKIANLAVGTAAIADAAITNAKILNLDAAKITTGRLDAARVQVGPGTQFLEGYNPLDAGWEKTYNVTTALPLPLTHPDGTNFNPDYSYEVQGEVRPTGTVTGASGIFSADTAGVWTYTKITEKGISGNHIDYFVLNNVPSVRTYAHANPYNVVTTHRRFNGVGSIGTALPLLWRFADTTFIDGGDIYTNTITANQIAANTITAAQIAANTITAAKMTAGTITAASGIIADAAITSAKIAALAVGTAAISDAAITNAKIANLAVDSAKIADAAITTAKIANLAVGTAAIANAAITDAKIINLDAAKITTGRLDAARVQIGSGTTFADGFDPTTKATSVEIDEKIDAIEIGGRNLVVRSGETKDKYLNLTGDETAVVGFSIMADLISVIPGESLFFTKGDDTQHWRWNWNDANNVFIGRAANIANEFQWTVPAGAYFLKVSYLTADEVKIERGTKATDFTPAPEDTSAEIGDAVAPANDRIALWQYADTTFIDGGNIYTNSVTANQIAAGAITANEIAANTITAAKMTAGTITAASGIIADATITTAKIAALAVGSAAIADLAVTSAKMANLAVTNAKIALLAVDTAQINAAAITSAKIANLAVGTAAIADAAITNAKIANLAVDNAKIVDAAITSAKIGALAVGTAAIQDLAVTSAKVQALDAAKITTGTLDANRIAANSITGGKIIAGTITATELATGSVIAAKIAAGAVTANAIAANSITSNMIVTAGLDAAVIKFGLMSGDRILANTINADRLKAGTVIANDITFTGILNGASGTFTGSIEVTGPSIEGEVNTINIEDGKFTTASSSGQMEISNAIIRSWSNSGDDMFINAQRAQFRYVNTGGVTSLVQYGGRNVNGILKGEISTTEDMTIRAARYIDFFTDGQTDRATFGFKNVESFRHAVIVMGDAAIKSLSGTTMVQFRNRGDTAYIELAASKFTVASDPKFKKDISPLARKVLPDLLKYEVQEYRMKEDAPEKRKTIGLRTDHAPADIVTEDGERIELYAYSSLNHKGLVELVQILIDNGTISAEDLK